MVSSRPIGSMRTALPHTQNQTFGWTVQERNPTALFPKLQDTAVLGTNPFRGTHSHWHPTPKAASHAHPHVHSEQQRRNKSHSILVKGLTLFYLIPRFPVGILLWGAWAQGLGDVKCGLCSRAPHLHPAPVLCKQRLKDDYVNRTALFYSKIPFTSFF